MIQKCKTKSDHFAVVGDIHGDIHLLKIVLDYVELNGLTAIFTGDYVDRGDFSKEVLDALVELKNKDMGHIFLLGNHERCLLDFFKDKDFLKYSKIGGHKTVQSYLKNQSSESLTVSKFFENFPESHMRFLTQLDLWWENEKLFVSHSGIDFCHPELRTEKALTGANSFDLEKAEVTNFSKRVICGHFTQKSRVPFISKNIICLDTGSGHEDGFLSLFRFPENKCLSFSRSGLDKEFDASE